MYQICITYRPPPVGVVTFGFLLVLTHCRGSIQGGQKCGFFEKNPGGLCFFGFFQKNVEKTLK